MVGGVKFRNQFLMLVAALLMISIIIGLFMLRLSERTTTLMVDEDKSMIKEAMDLMDLSLGPDFDSFLQKAETQKSGQEKIKFLDEKLTPLFASVQKAYPGMEIGVYFKDFNTILTSDQADNLSSRRKQALTDTINTGQTLESLLNRPTGIYIDGYKPLERGGRTIGAIWVRESVNPIYQREKKYHFIADLVITCGVIIGIGGSFFLLGNFLRAVSAVKDGLQHLKQDLSYRLPKASGELGDISAAINELAQELARSQSYNEIILASVVEALLALDSEGRVISCNAQARQLFNLPGLVPGDKPAENEGNLPLACLGKALAGEMVHDLEMETGAKHVLLTTRLLVDNQGEVRGALLAGRDITTRMQLEKKVRQQDRLAALGRLVAGVAHEIRNPLTSISGYTQYWQKNPHPSPRALATICREVNRLNTIVEKLLYFAHPGQAVYGAHDLNRMVAGVMQFFRTTHASLVLEEKLAQDLPSACMDPAQMEQVLRNLLYNAIQAMPGGGRILVETGYDREKNLLAMTVADSGPGIAEEHLPYLFDPFFSTHKQGTGLGLAIAHEIVVAHGGRIEVESVPDGGATFKVYIPLAGREKDVQDTSG